MHQDATLRLTVSYMPLLYWRFVAAVFFVLCIISGCAPDHAPPFRVGLNNWPGYAPLYLSSLLNPASASDFQLIPMASSADVMHGIRSGTLEAGALTLDEVITLANDGIALRIVLIFDISMGGDAILGKPFIESLSDLRNRTVAVENSTVSALVLRRAMDIAQLTENDIDLMYCPLQNHLTCFNEADAIVTFEPMKSKIQNVGAHILFDSQDMPNEILDVLAVTESAYPALSTTINSMVADYYQTVASLNADNNFAHATLAEFTGLTIDELDRAYEGIELPTALQAKTLMSGQPSPLAQLIDHTTEVLRDQGLVQNDHMARPIIDHSHIDVTP